MRRTAEQWLGKALVVASLVLLASAAMLLRKPAHVVPSSVVRGGNAGADTVVALLVASQCPASSNPITVRRVRALLDDVAATRAAGSRLRLMGVAIDQRPDDGYRLLTEFGTFDEVSLGGGWGNLVLTRFVWNDTAGIPAIPQVIMFTRQIEVVDDKLTEMLAAVESVAVGSDAVIQWLRAFAESRSQ
jgi:hypothetical protein